MPKQLHIYLIDDDPNDQDFFATAVSRMPGSITCTYADDGVQALEKLKGDPHFVPDFIFIDINMPIMNGIEVLNEIKKIERLHRVPLYMYSTAADPYVSQKCIRLGAAGVIKKLPGINLLSNSIAGILFEQKITIE